MSDIITTKSQETGLLKQSLNSQTAVNDRLLCSPQNLNFNYRLNNWNTNERGLIAVFKTFNMKM